MFNGLKRTGHAPNQGRSGSCDTAVARGVEALRSSPRASAIRASTFSARRKSKGHLSMSPVDPISPGGDSAESDNHLGSNGAEKTRRETRTARAPTACWRPSTIICPAFRHWAGPTVLRPGRTFSKPSPIRSNCCTPCGGAGPWRSAWESRWPRSRPVCCGSSCRCITRPLPC